MVTKLTGYKKTIAKLDDSELGRQLFESAKAKVEISAKYTDSKGNTTNLSFKAEYNPAPFDRFAEILPKRDPRYPLGYLPLPKLEIPDLKYKPWYENPLKPIPMPEIGLPEVDPGFYLPCPTIPICPICPGWREPIQPIPMPSYPDFYPNPWWKRPPIIIIIIPQPSEPIIDWDLLFPPKDGDPIIIDPKPKDPKIDPIKPPVIKDDKKDDDKVDPKPKDPKIDPQPKKDEDPKIDPNPKKDEEPKTDNIEPKVEDEPKPEEVKPELPKDILSSGKLSASEAKRRADEIFAYMDKVFQSKMSLAEKRQRTAQAISVLKKLEKKIGTKTGKASYKDYVYNKLGSIYRKTADAQTKKSPYFDTDGDGHYDTDDFFALHRKYHSDADRDEVPDKIDAFPDDPSKWNNLPVGKTVKMKGIDGQKYLVTKQPDGTIMYKVKVYLKPGAGVSAADVAAFKRRTEREVEEYFNRRFGKHRIKFDLEYVNSRSQATSIFNLQKKHVRENTSRLHVNTTSRVLAHELGHCIGIDDYYHERGRWNDRTYAPGWECMSRGCLMTDCGPSISDHDILIPGAVASVDGTPVAYA